MEIFFGLIVFALIAYGIYRFIQREKAPRRYGGYGGGGSNKDNQQEK